MLNGNIELCGIEGYEIKMSSMLFQIDQNYFQSFWKHFAAKYLTKNIRHNRRTPQIGKIKKFSILEASFGCNFSVNMYVWKHKIHKFYSVSWIFPKTAKPCMVWLKILETFKSSTILTSICEHCRNEKNVLSILFFQFDFFY